MAKDGYYELTFAQMRECIERHYKRVQVGTLALDAQRELAAIAWALIGRAESTTSNVLVKDYGARWWKERGE